MCRPGKLKGIRPDLSFQAVGCIRIKPFFGYYVGLILSDGIVLAMEGAGSVAVTVVICLGEGEYDNSSLGIRLEEGGNDHFHGGAGGEDIVQEEEGWIGRREGGARG